MDAPTNQADFITVAIGSQENQLSQPTSGEYPPESISDDAEEHEELPTRRYS